MKITRPISVDLSARGCINRIDAVQGDTAREVAISLYSNGAAWEVPFGAAVLIRFRKFDGTGGTYDSLPDGSRAYSVSGNVLRVALAPQVLTAEGAVTMQVAFLQGTDIVATFPMTIQVYYNPAIGTVQSEDYTSIGEWILPAAVEAAETAMAAAEALETAAVAASAAAEAASQSETGSEYQALVAAADAQRATDAALNAETAAQRAETAASSIEGAALNAETAAQRAETAAQRALSPVFTVNITNFEGTYVSDKTVEAIQAASAERQAVQCLIQLEDQIELPLTRVQDTSCRFSAVCDGIEYLVILTEAEEQSQTHVEVSYKSISVGSLEGLQRYVINVYPDNNNPGAFITSKTVGDIQIAYEAGKILECALETPEQSHIMLHLGDSYAGEYRFSAVFNGSEWSAVFATAEDGSTLISVHQLSLAQKQSSVFYIPGDNTSTPSAWTGSHPEISDYYDGLTVLYIAPNDGPDAGFVTLNINGLGAVKVFAEGQDPSQTYSEGSVFLLTYTNNRWLRSDRDPVVKKTVPNYEYPMEITEGKYKHLDGWDTNNAIYSYATVEVVEGHTITITGWQAASSMGFYAYYFYAEDGSCIAHYETSDSGVAVTSTVVVPEGAVKLVVNFQPGANGFASVVGDYTVFVPLQDIFDDLEKHSSELAKGFVCYGDKQTLTDAEQEQARINIGVNAKRTVPNYEYPLEITSGKIRNKDGYEMADSQYEYATTDVVPGDILTITGYQAGYDYGFHLYYFYGADGKLVDSFYKEASGMAITIEGVVVPEGAATLLVNGHTTKANLSVVGSHTQPVTIQDAFDELEKQNEKIDAALMCETTVSNFEYVAERTEPKCYNREGWEGAFDGTYEFKEFRVSAGDIITISGFQPGSSYGYYLYYFLDGAKNVVSYYETTESGVVLTKTVAVPEGAVKLIVNGKQDRVQIRVVGERTGVYGLSQAFQEIEKLKLVEPKRQQPKLMTLGDSITALGIGERGWVGYFLEKTGCELVANVAVVGATLHDKVGTVYDGNPVFQGADNNVNNVLGNQVEKIIRNNYEAPDIILIAVGTNGALDNPKVNPWDGGVRITKEDMSATYYSADKSLIPLEDVDRTKDAGAYRYALEKLHSLYPNAIIFWCTPIHAHQKMRTAEEISANAESLRIATDYTGQILIDTHRCGINGVNEHNNANGEYLIDGLHPNINGAKKIGYYNASKVEPFLKNLFVET